ncbi:MAG TPA: glycosyltransferase family 4 protein [Burkholderiales bacterium]|nr:glycosyltransferase family 4 protein [Burkholderiales bacterium]
MTRALFVTGSLSHGGAERHSIALMNRLAERRHECHAVYVKSGADQLERIRLRGSGTVQCLGAARYFDWAALQRFATHLGHLEPAAIVAANPYALMYAAWAMRLARRRVPLIVTYHSTRLLGLKEQLQMAAYRPLFWGADCAVFVCESQRRYWRRRGVFSRRNEVIHNGVDTEAFSSARDAGAGGRMRAALGFRASDYVIGLTAVLRPEKNPLQLVDAIALLRARGMPAKALFVGDGPLRSAVEARSRARGVAQDVVIAGIQQDVRPHIAACDVMALCSRTEAFSLAALEAMAMGKPVVHAEVGGAAEMISGGHNGILFAVGDTEAFAAALATLAQRSACERMGGNARRVVEALFSEATMVDRYERLFLELSGERLRPGAELAH